MDFPETGGFLKGRRGEAVFLAAAVVLAVLYRGWNFFAIIGSGIPGIGYVSYDGVYYVQTARNILSGDGPGWEATIFPILQPILIAFISFFTSIKNLPFISSFISQVAGVALLIPVYLLAKRIYGWKAAAVAVFILIPYPHLVAIAAADTAESLYCFFIYLSLYAGYEALTGGKRLLYFLAGASLGLTYLARPEGLFIFIIFLGLCLWKVSGDNGPQAALKASAVVAAGFLLFALPYIAFLTKSYGRVAVSSKLPFESIVMKAKVLNEPMEMSEIQGLTEKGNIVWREKGGAGVVLGYIKKDPGKMFKVYLANLKSELPWNVRNSSHLEGYPIAYPIYLWLLALFAFLLLLIRPEKRWAGLLIWAPFFNFFIYPVFASGFWIYHAPYIPSLVILAAGGLLWLSERLKASTGKAIPLLLIAVAAWSAYSVNVRISSRPEKHQAVTFKSAVADEMLKVGEWSRQNLGTDATFMMDWSRLVYYLGGRWVELPYARHDRIIEYGKRNGADYLIEERIGDAAFEGSRFVDTPYLQHFFSYRSPNVPYVVYFYKIEGHRTLARGHTPPSVQ